MRMHFNKIIVIESLGSGKTGKRLYEDLLLWKPLPKNQDSALYREVSTREHFFQLLEEIAEETKKNNLLPILHIECHGNTKGIQLSSGQFVSWEELRQSLTRINIYSRNNTLLVLAACQGAYISQLMNPVDRAPFVAIVGHKDEITFEQVERDFKAFYDELLTSFNGDKAIEKINLHLPEDKKYTFVGCDRMYELAFQNYAKQYCSEEVIKARVDATIAEAISQGRIDIPGIPKYRKMLEDLYSDTKTAFERMIPNHFMMDLYPENNGRFNPKYQNSDSDGQ